jgi:hypothetical protein
MEGADQDEMKELVVKDEDQKEKEEDDEKKARRRQRIPMGWEEIGWKWMGGDRMG